MRERNSSVPLTGTDANLRPLLTALLLSVCAGLVYGGALHSPFVFDDQLAIVDNLQVRKLWPLSDAMTPMADLPTSNRPLVALSFSLNYAFGGLDVTGYHLVNIGLHVANTWLVFSLLLQLLAHEQLPARARRAALPLAAAIALIWCVHPLLSESVVYVTQRTELMSAFFYLAALVCAMRSFRAPAQRLWQWLACTAALLGIGSKETAATIAVAILCLDRLAYAPSLSAAWRTRRVLYTGLALQFALAAVVCLAAPFKHGDVGFSDGISPLQWLATQAAVIVIYVSRTMWPDVLSISYHIPVAQDLLRYWPQLLAVSALFVASLWLAARAPLLAFPALLFFIYLAPSSSVVPTIAEVAGERRMYVPSLVIIFYAVLLGHWVLCRLRLSPRLRMLAALLVTLAVSAGLAARTLARVQDYASGERLWSAALEANPEDPQAQLALASITRAAGDLARARSLASPLLGWQREFKGAIDWAARAHISLAETDEADAQLRSALAHYDAVSSDSRDLRVALINGARVLLRLERPADAAQRLQRAIALGYNGIHEHHDLGVALSMLGQHQAAAEHFERAYNLDPSRPDSLKALATSLYMQGRLAQAATVLEEVVRTWPDDSAAHDKLDRVLAALDQGRR